MRQWAFLLVLAGMALPAFAARRVSVAELEQLLAAAHGQPDKKVAKQIDDLELTERVSYTRLTQWEAGLPGSQSREALTKIADGAAFLGPAPEDVPDTPKPDREAQIQMVKKAMDYTVEALHRLPNFMATRQTKTFESLPHIEETNHTAAAPTGQTELNPATSVDGEGNDFGRLFVVDSWNSRVTYRDGEEVADDEQKRSDTTPRALSTWGVFGPILSVVLSDALQGKLIWEHWERGPNGDYGVFSYTVPQVYSHFNVDTGNPLDIGDPGNTISVFPAYHGEIGIDPATGSIMRISEQAEFAGTQAGTKAASIQVEYGAVEIGGSPYICPVRSVALCRREVLSLTRMPNSITQLNDVVFTNYHVFRTESRILSVGITDGRGGTAGDAKPAQQPDSKQK
jgi:hypothetical protein